MKTILIKNARFYDSNLKLQTDKQLLIRDGVITEIRNNTDNKTTSPKTFDAKDYIILPSLINAHYHLGETVYRGKAPLLSLNHYLKYTSSKNRLFSSKDYDIISQISLFEALISGTSTVGCARGWNILKKMNMRGLLGYPLMISKKLESYAKIINEFNPKDGRYTHNFSNGSPQIRPAIWIHSIQYTNNEMLRDAAKICEKYDLPVMIHTSETIEQTQSCLNKNGCSEVELLDEYGLIGSKTNIVHGCHLTKKDIGILKKKNANITICPTSNLMLNGSVPKLDSIMDAGINVSIATDGLATNFSSSLMDAARNAFLIYRNMGLDAKILFRMITTNPARTLGFNGCGSIKEGALADLNLYHMRDSRTISSEDFLRLVMFSDIYPANVMINGTFVVQNYDVLTIDNNIFKKYSHIVEKIR
ncbi:MAG: amidohydrolase family protein [Candidatus Woesearchaeota archaeon]